MKLNSSQNKVPRNVIILAIAVTIILGIFRLVLFLILVWVAALAFMLIYQYKTSRRTTGNFVCLDCAMIHQDMVCPKCGSKLKKLYSRNNEYGI
jgi:uncharacterized paraquat-inducible protein A